MLKRMSLKKIIVCLIALFSLGILYLLPNQKLETKNEVEYVSENKSTEIIYVESKHNYLSRVSINVENAEISTKAKELLEDLIIDNKESKLPNGFKGVIPKNTKINSLEYKDNVIKIDFSSELMNTKKDNEEKIIESIVYTLTSLPDVKYIIIYMDGEILTELPQSKINLPTTLDRSFGINKSYNITSDKNITKTTIYYIDNINNQDYYVPVTKINNDSRDKIEIIIEELSNNIPNNKLMSYLNNNTQLVSSNIDKDQINLVFNDYILDDTDSQEILDEVIYTICLSIQDNYYVNAVTFNINDKEIHKTVLKSLE